MNYNDKLLHEASRWRDTLFSVLVMEWFPQRTKYSLNKEGARKSRDNLLDMCQRIRILDVARVALSPVIVAKGLRVDADMLARGRRLVSP